MPVKKLGPLPSAGTVHLINDYAMNTRETTLVVIGNDALARAGVSALLAGEGFVVAAELSEDEASAEVVKTFMPQVVVWDCGWGEIQQARAEAIRAIDLPTLVLVADGQQGQEARSAEPRGILLRTARPRQIRAAIHALVEGIAVFEPVLFGEVQPIVPRHGQTSSEEFTPRELQVLRLVAEGLPNKVIAARLNVTEHTVKFHVNAILGKLGAQSRTEAVTKATRMGLIIL